MKRMNVPKNKKLIDSLNYRDTKVSFVHEVESIQELEERLEAQAYWRGIPLVVLEMTDDHSNSTCSCLGSLCACDGQDCVGVCMNLCLVDYP